jgi:hypothetical protein
MSIEIPLQQFLLPKHNELLTKKAIEWYASMKSYESYAL